MLQTRSLDNNRLFIPCGNMSSNNDVLLFYGAVSKLTNDLSEYYNKLFQEGLFSKVNTNVKEKDERFTYFLRFL